MRRASVLNIIALSFQLLSHPVVAAESCRYEEIDGETGKIISTNDDAQLILLGHTHRSYSALDRFVTFIDEAAKNAVDRAELRKDLDRIRKYSDMRAFYEDEAGPTYEKLKKLIRANEVDFIGIESPFVIAQSRAKKIGTAAELYAKLAKEAYGSQYVEENLEKDLLGMFGPNWYFLIKKPAGLKAEGVESAFVEQRFGEGHQRMVSLLTKISAYRTEENKQVLDMLIGTLGSTSKLNAKILPIAKSKLSPAIFREVEEAAKLREKFDDEYNLRDEWMLTSMKSRARRVGLLLVGRDHVGSMPHSAKAYCRAKKSEGIPVKGPAAAR